MKRPPFRHAVHLAVCMMLFIMPNPQPGCNEEEFSSSSLAGEAVDFGASCPGSPVQQMGLRCEPRFEAAWHPERRWRPRCSDGAICVSDSRKGLFRSLDDAVRVSHGGMWSQMTYFSRLNGWVLLQEGRHTFWAQNSCWLCFTFAVLSVLNKYAGILVCICVCVRTQMCGVTGVHGNPCKWGRRDQYGFPTFCKPGNWSVSYWIPLTINEVCVVIPSTERKKWNSEWERAWPKQPRIYHLPKHQPTAQHTWPPHLKFSELAPVNLISTSSSL